ncbi:MAG: oxidoreductase [Acidimicrobiales bacterium]|nr:oxidoreductase [Acidimicrobiales bacterium]
MTVGWTTKDIPDLTGRTAIVTGANSGIGFETAAALAAAGATVVLACRNPERAAASQAAIEERHPKAQVEVLRLDLASQSQIADAAAATSERFSRVDLLVNNAGVMGTERSVTPDGHEMLFGTNNLGHFAYTGRILPRLLDTPGARVVTVTSLSYRVGRIRWDDLALERTYSESRAYSQSKLANAMFCLELQRRLAVAGVSAVSVGAHPGFAATDIIAERVDRHPRYAGFMKKHLIQTAEEAARSSLRAATDPGAYGGQFYGPSKLGGTSGPPRAIPWVRRALDEGDQARLWQLSEKLTGVTYDI